MTDKEDFLDKADRLYERNRDWKLEDEAEHESSKKNQESRNESDTHLRDVEEHET